MDERRSRILEVNRAAQEFFRDSLNDPDYKEAGAALRTLGIKPETAERFGLGYAPASTAWMTVKMASEGWSTQLMEEAGLVKVAGQPCTRLVFTDRLTFPFRDADGNVLGFAGRRVNGEDPVWLISKDTPVFDRKSTLFGLDLAVKSGKDRFILVEGLVDAVLLNQEGFAETVAPAGTGAVTPEQARLLGKYAKSVTVVADPDGPGKLNAGTSAENLRGAGLDVKVAELPGEDAVGYVRTHGAAAFARLVSAGC